MPRDSDAALRSALLAVLDRDLDRAETLLAHAVRIDSDSVEPYVALARLFRMRGEIGRAIRIHQNLLLRADVSTPEGVAILADLAADFRAGGFLQRAISAYEEVLVHDSKHRVALTELVALLAEIRQFSRAIEMARRLARIEKRRSRPGEAVLYVEMAEAARAEGRIDEARRAVKRALRKDRSSGSAWQLLGNIEAERGRTRSALNAWSRVLELDPARGAAVHPQLEATYAALGRTRDYERFLRKLLEKRPDDGASRLALGRTLAARGDIDEAVTELNRRLDVEPGDLRVRATLGRVLLADGRDAEAIKAYAELLDRIGTHPAVDPRGDEVVFQGDRIA